MLCHLVIYRVFLHVISFVTQCIHRYFSQTNTDIYQIIHSHYSHTPYNISYSHTTVKYTNTSQIRTQQQHITSLMITTHQFTFRLHSSHSLKYTIATNHFTQFISTESKPFAHAYTYTLLHIYTSTIFNILPIS